MHNKKQVTFPLPDLQDQKSLTLRLRSFSEWGSKHVTSVFGFTGGHYLIFGYLSAVTLSITKIQYQKSVTLH